MATTTQTNGTIPHPTRNIEFFAGSSRFEIECEFVQTLSNPLFIHHLAATKYLENEDFIRYIDYLQYWRKPQYVKYLQYPGPTLRALELLQQEQFRKDAINPAVIDRMVQEGFEAAAGGEVGKES